MGGGRGGDGKGMPSENDPEIQEALEKASGSLWSDTMGQRFGQRKKNSRYPAILFQWDSV